jgi:hypothetical protein
MQVNRRRLCRLKNVLGPGHFFGSSMSNEKVAVCFEGRLVFEDVVLWNAHTRGDDTKVRKLSGSRSYSDARALGNWS